MQKNPPIKYSECQLGDVPFGKFFSLTKPTEKLTFTGKDTDIWFRGKPSDLMPVTEPHYSQCVRIDGKTLQEPYSDLRVFLLSNILCNTHCRFPVEKNIADIEENECIIQEDSCWIIIKDAPTCSRYSGKIIFNPPTGRFRHITRNCIVQSTVISRASTQQY